MFAVLSFNSADEFQRVHAAITIKLSLLVMLPSHSGANSIFTLSFLLYVLTKTILHPPCHCDTSLLADIILRYDTLD